MRQRYEKNLNISPNAAVYIYQAAFPNLKGTCKTPKRNYLRPEIFFLPPEAKQVPPVSPSAVSSRPMRQTYGHFCLRKKVTPIPQQHSENSAG